MRTILRLLAVLVLALLSVMLLPVQAYNVEKTTNNSFENTSGNFISWSQNIYMTSIEEGGPCNCVNFTNVALGNPSNPSQTFGLGVLNSNATIEEIAATYITLSTTCLSAYCYARYYFIGDNPPPLVYFSIGTPAVVSTPNFTNSFSFQSDQPNAILFNETGNILIRYEYANTLRISFTSISSSFPTFTTPTTITKVINSTSTLTLTTVARNLGEAPQKNQFDYWILLYLAIVGVGAFIVEQAIVSYFGSIRGFIQFLVNPEERKQVLQEVRDLKKLAKRGSNKGNSDDDKKNT